MLSTHFDRAVSDDASAEKIVGEGDERRKISVTGISDLTTNLVNELLTPQTEAGRDFTPAETTESPFDQS